MGGAVASVMEFQSDRSMVREPFFAERACYGPINICTSEPAADRSGIYRCSRLSEEEHRISFDTWSKTDHLLKLLKQNCDNHPQKSVIAYRTVKNIEKQVSKDEKGREKTWEITHLNEPQYITYGGFWDMLSAFGKGMRELGLSAGDRVVLYEETRWEWLTSMLGLWSQSMIGVTVYSNLGYDALIYALQEAQCKVVVCNGSGVERVASLMASKDVMEAPIVYMDELPAGANTHGMKVMSWKDVLELGKKSSVEENIPSNNDDVCLIMYTSGTTGNPKGVMHSLGALTQGAKALGSRLTELLGKDDKETYLSYLPSAHIFEFICEMIMVTRGILLCFGTPRTLMDVFARPRGDLSEFNPFFIIGVPRIFETIKKAVEAKLPPVGTVKRTIFDRAYASRLAAIKQGMDTPVWNEKVFKLPRSVMGQKIRGMCSGGAPLGDRTQEWINVVMGIPLAQGYGMTETVCNATVQRTGELHCVAGQFLQGVEGMLLDTDDYKHTDKPNPRGELCLRGGFNFKGYYNQPELTKECMMEGGWIRTGDVAEIEVVTGQVKIISRVKALAKNLLGEYIALESLEALYGMIPLATPNGVCVLVDSQKAYITALVLTDEAKALTFAKQKKIAGEWPEILENPQFQTAAAEAMAALAKKERKMPFEMVKYVRVLADEWTPENGLVTASLKVRRSHIDKHYADTIKELFSE